MGQQWDNRGEEQEDKEISSGKKKKKINYMIGCLFENLKICWRM